MTPRWTIAIAAALFMSACTDEDQAHDDPGDQTLTPWIALFGANGESVASGTELYVEVYWQRECDGLGPEHPCDQQRFRIDVSCDGVACELGPSEDEIGTGAVRVTPRGAGTLTTRALVVNLDDGREFPATFPLQVR